MVRSNSRNPINLHGLSTSATLVLFTPVVSLAKPPLQAGKATTTAETTDPFEPLGRAVSQYHPRICHVPYIPSVGFTDTHDAFLSEAAVVVVVIVCAPQMVTNNSSNEAVVQQLDFAEAAHDRFEATQPAPPKYPPILVHCGTAGATGAEFSSSVPDLSHFAHVLKCRSYGPDSALQIAGGLFGARK